MFFHAPSFWYQPVSPRAAALKPLAALYQWLARLRWRFVQPARLNIPVICVGNVVVGGAGKTPVVQDLAARLPGCHIVSRGYGGTEKGPLKVDFLKNTAAEVGDEPLMLAEKNFVWVGKNRAAAAQAAANAGATLILMDDGLQNHSLIKTRSFLVIDGGKQLGNGLTLPAGPLRESIDEALAKTAAIIWLGEPTMLMQELGSKKPVLRATSETFCRTHNLAGQKVFAFSGIAHPEKFFESLKTLGAEVVATQKYADHYLWHSQEIAALLEEAASHGAIPVTTAKDAARINAALKTKIAVCDVRLKWADEAALQKFLKI